MANLTHKRFTFPDKCDVRSVVMRETNGHDEQRAAMQADAQPGRSSVFQELVRLSIVSVDGQLVQQPFLDLDRWNSRTRALVIQAYENLNDLKDEEIAVFLAASEDATPGLAQPEAVAKEDDDTTGE